LPLVSEEIVSRASLRILVLIHEYPPVGGGGGAAARDICRGLARRGHHVTVLTVHFRGLAYREQDQGVEVLRIPTLRQQPYRASLLEMSLFVLGALWAGYRLIREQKPDVLHAHFAVPAGAAAWLLWRLTGIPYLLTAHLGDVPGGVPEKTAGWFRWIKPFTLPIWHNAAQVIAVSRFTRDLAQQSYPVPIQVIPNGVPLAALAPAEIVLHHPRRIVFAGRLVEQKNPLQVLRTLATLRDLPWECVMLGDGALRERVWAEIERLELKDRVRLLGWATPERVLEEFRQSDVLFMPSRSEGLPVVGVQALACGLALVVGRAGGFVELVDGNGSLHDADDTKGMAAGLRWLLSDADALLAARRRSLELAQAFDLEHVIVAYEKTLLALANPSLSQ